MNLLPLKNLLANVSTPCNAVKTKLRQSSKLPYNKPTTTSLFTLFIDLHY